ncbi:phospho-sugar mutase [Candidatus Poriferisocius sp.]|uniref:phospho-sugar mutase n=1 Tax=Candidatus Poriferisocius sp. TaxID=3101276 RepID=UPI003B01509A
MIPQAPTPEEWLAADPDPVTRAELRQLIDTGDQAGIDDRFGDRLRFGTAGIRGPMGAGPNRINRVVARQFAAALAEWLGGSGGVVIAHDARQNSDIFAADIAEVLAGAGCWPVMLPPNSPTPVLAFAVTELTGAAGVMVTASHNPVGDNGFKLYLADGAQVIPPHDQAIEAAMAAQPLPPCDLPDRGSDPEWPQKVSVEVDYIAAILANVPRLYSFHPLAYTPLQGVGLHYVNFALTQLDNGEPFVVEDEAEPDPLFRNVVSPNPEDHDTLAKVIKRAEQIDTPLAIANDPDADRMAAVVWAYQNEWRVLTGDEIGALLCDWILGLSVESGGDERVVASSIVSGRLVGRIAEARGATHVETLTGFKWIARAADNLKPRPGHLPWRFVFGYEEALGFACNNRVRDKDGISAAVHFTMMCRWLAYEFGRTPIERLAELMDEFGLHRTDQVSVELGRRPGAEIMEAVRADLPSQFGGVAVTEITDFKDGARGLYPADVLRFDLADDSRVSLRPSGTEPQIKGYIEVVGDIQIPDPLFTLSEAVRELILGL